MKQFGREEKQRLLDDATNVALSVHQVAASGTETVQQDQGKDQVTVYWGDILPWLADALESKRSWMQDFDMDKVVISKDFHEVLCAYRRYRGNLDRPDANHPVTKAA